MQGGALDISEDYDSSSNTMSNTKPFDPQKIVFRPARTSKFWLVIDHTDQEVNSLLDRPATLANFFDITKENRDGTVRLEKRYFEIIHHYLVMRKSLDKVPVNYLDLTFIHLEFNISTHCKTKYFVLLLSNIKKFDRLITTDESLAYKWYFILTKFCVGIKFKDMYDLNTAKPLGVGGFGSVFIAKLKNGGIFGNRAVKILSKTKMFYQQSASPVDARTKARMEKERVEKFYVESSCQRSKDFKEA